MLLSVAGSVLLLVSVSCFALVLLHAFARSVGTGVVVLMLPVYNVVYAFTQFEHRLKGWVIAGWLGGFVGGVVLRTMAFVAR
jgi:translocator protein